MTPQILYPITIPGSHNRVTQQGNQPQNEDHAPISKSKVTQQGNQPQNEDHAPISKSKVTQQGNKTHSGSNVNKSITKSSVPHNPNSNNGAINSQRRTYASMVSGTPKYMPAISPLTTSMVDTSNTTPEIKNNIYNKIHNVTSNPSEKYLPFVEVQTSVSTKRLKLLVDSGASISLIKKSSIQNMPEIDEHTITFSGIGTADKPMKSFGRIPIEFNSLKYRFHIIDNINFPYDGIIGNDFLSDNYSNIDFRNESLTISQVELALKFNEPIYTIAPRTETIIECSVLNPEIGEGLMVDQNPVDSILIANCIVKVKPNSRINISVVNISESLITLNSNLKLTPLENKENHQIFNISHTIPNNAVNRTEQVLDLLRVTHLNNEERDSLFNLCAEFSDIFHLPEDSLTCTNALEHQIPTSSSVPINTKSYRFPEVHKQEVNNQINKMLNEGIIKPSTSPWSSPIWIVPKKLDASGQRKWRIVIDYRRLNDITIGDSYPIPNISEIFRPIG
ncbi:unnamed protein product [Pieris macdunnoughi]|uniref:Peptidase A2 domain-containing protein n=1 Tax=Pieris macdunnoughi TaxID=345717 RepID=A0A821Y110_9NEOP|nr:unnamed protein product [Pieris macdunnoughi]